DGIDYTIIGNDSAVDAAFLASQLDIVSSSAITMTKPRMESYTKAFGDKVGFYDIGAYSDVLVFNTLLPGPFQDVRVRRAVAFGVDKAGFGPRHGGQTYPKLLFNPRSPFSTPPEMFTTWPGWSRQSRDQDRAQAKQLLADAGYANGFSTSMLTAAPNWMDDTVYFQAQLAELGIDAKIEGQDPATFLRTQSARQSPLLNYHPPPSSITVPEQTEPFYSVTSKFPSSILVHEDSKVAEYYDQLRAVPTDQNKRTNVWRGLEKYLIDQA